MNTQNQNQSEQFELANTTLFAFWQKKYGSKIELTFLGTNKTLDDYAREACGEGKLDLIDNDFLELIKEDGEEIDFTIEKPYYVHSGNGIGERFLVAYEGDKTGTLDFDGEYDTVSVVQGVQDIWSKDMWFALFKELNTLYDDELLKEILAYDREHNCYLSECSYWRIRNIADYVHYSSAFDQSELTYLQDYLDDAKERERIY